MGRSESGLTGNYLNYSPEVWMVTGPRRGPVDLVLRAPTGSIVPKDFRDLGGPDVAT